MGLTNSAMGIKTLDSELKIHKESADDIVVALAGNPNVGKSTVFNSLTGLNQHTGNWPGKTVVNAQGVCKRNDQNYVLVDIPGTYSLLAHSTEEEVARNFICFGEHDAVVVVCDATCLERNLNLVLQTIEITNKVVVCVNLLDEAKRKKIKINLSELSKKLSVPVVGTIARKKATLDNLLKKINNVIINTYQERTLKIEYPEMIEEAIKIIEPVLSQKLESEELDGKLNCRWLSLQLLDKDESLFNEIEDYVGEGFLESTEIVEAVDQAKLYLEENGVISGRLKDLIVSSLVNTSEDICKGVVTSKQDIYQSKDHKIDKILTSKWFGYPLMLLLLMCVFWL